MKDLQKKVHTVTKDLANLTEKYDRWKVHYKNNGTPGINSEEQQELDKMQARIDAAEKILRKTLEQIHQNLKAAHLKRQAKIDLLKKNHKKYQEQLQKEYELLLKLVDSWKKMVFPNRYQELIIKTLIKQQQKLIAKLEKKLKEEAKPIEKCSVGKLNELNWGILEKDYVDTLKNELQDFEHHINKFVNEVKAAAAKEGENDNEDIFTIVSLFLPALGSAFKAFKFISRLNDLAQDLSVDAFNAFTGACVEHLKVLSQNTGPKMDIYQFAVNWGHYYESLKVNLPKQFNELKKQLEKRCVNSDINDSYVKKITAELAKNLSREFLKFGAKLTIAWINASGKDGGIGDEPDFTRRKSSYVGFRLKYHLNTGKFEGHYQNKIPWIDDVPDGTTTLVKTKLKPGTAKKLFHKVGDLGLNYQIEIYLDYVPDELKKKSPPKKDPPKKGETIIDILGKKIKEEGRKVVEEGKALARKLSTRHLVVLTREKGKWRTIYKNKSKELIKKHPKKWKTIKANARKYAKNFKVSGLKPD